MGGGGAPPNPQEVLIFRRRGELISGCNAFFGGTEAVSIIVLANSPIKYKL